MKNLTFFKKSLILLAVIFASTIFSSKAQGFEPYPGMTQLNFGIGTPSWGFPIYAGLDFGITDHITIGPRADVRFGQYLSAYNRTIFNIGFRGDYHFGNHIDALPSELDLYGGVTGGYSIWSYNYDGVDPDVEDSGVLFHFQAGGRWYFTDNWSGNAELTAGTFGGVSVGGLTVGLSYLF